MVVFFLYKIMVIKNKEKMEKKQGKSEENLRTK